jgi:hypothetical protein
MKVDAALGRGAGDAEHLIFVGRRGGKGESSPLSLTSFARVRVRVFPFPRFVFLIPTLIYASRLGSDTIVEFGIATAYVRSGVGSCQGMREREKRCGTHLRGSRDPAWVLVAAWSPW